MSNWKVFAEDAGTGLQDQSDHDFGDGANFGAHVHSPNDTDYAPVAPTLSADYTALDVTLGEAQYKVKATNVSGRVRDGTQTTWPEVTFVVKAPQTTLSLTDGVINHIYVDVDLTTTGDDAQYVVNTTGSAPANPSLKVAEVDTSANTTDVFSANPNVVGQTVASQYVINDDVSVPDGHGAVAVGPLEGDGSITGDGRLAVIQEGTQFTDNVDAQGNDINNVGAVGANSLSTDDTTINHGIVRGRNKERIDASKFDDPNADSRLDSALSNASDGDIIYLESNNYNADRTISQRVTFVGTGLVGNRAVGTKLNGANWTLSTRCVVKSLNAINSSTVTFDARGMFLGGSATSTDTIQVNADNIIISNLLGWDVIFNSTTSGGVVDTCSKTTITDNGANTVGDVS